MNFFSLFRSQVYLPCVLQTKKRYVGYMYESLDQKEPVFDAKGIETVRRDSCPAVSKVTGENQPASFLHHFHCVLHRSLPRQLSFGSGLRALLRLCQSGSCQLRGHGWLFALMLKCPTATAFKHQRMDQQVIIHSFHRFWSVPSSCCLRLGTSAR